MTQAEMFATQFPDDISLDVAALGGDGLSSPIFGTF